MVLSKIHLHISNCGVTFEIQDSGHGPEIHIRTSAFGNLENELVVNTTVGGLIEIQNVIRIALHHQFSPDYSNAVIPE